MVRKARRSHLITNDLTNQQGKVESTECDFNSGCGCSDVAEVTEDKWSKEYKDSIDCNNPKELQSACSLCQGRKKNEDKRIPKTRDNQDPDTHSDLYTDEDPRGTIHGLGFKDVETARASVKKIESSDRTHAHKVQAAIAMEQRIKVMGKTAEAKVYRDYIEKMKKKTKEMQSEVFGITSVRRESESQEGSGERMRKKGEKGSSTQDQIDRAKSEDKKYYKSGKIKKSPEDKESGPVQEVCQRSKRQRSKAESERDQETNVSSEGSSRRI